MSKKDEPLRESETAEIAVLNHNGLMNWAHGNEIEGYVSTKKVAKVLFYVSHLPEDFNELLDWDKMIVSDLNLHLEEDVLKGI